MGLGLAPSHIGRDSLPVPQASARGHAAPRAGRGSRSRLARRARASGWPLSCVGRRFALRYNPLWGKASPCPARAEFSRSGKRPRRTGRACPMRMEVQREISRVTPRLAALSRADRAGLRAAPMPASVRQEALRGRSQASPVSPADAAQTFPDVMRRRVRNRRGGRIPPPRRRFLGFLTNIAFRPDV